MYYKIFLSRKDEGLELKVTKEIEIVKATNLREVPKKILSLMGKECEKYYN
jgi:hypothetical protein